MAVTTNNRALCDLEEFAAPTYVTVLAYAACKQWHRGEDPQALLDDTFQVTQLLQVLYTHVAV